MSYEVKRFVFQKMPVRTIIHEDGKPWFVAHDVCAILGYSRTRNALRMVEENEKGVHKLSTPGGPQEMLIVNESGLYYLIMRSRRSEAKTFRCWVTDKVLPSIRKTGMYTLSQNNREIMVAQGLLAANEIIKEQQLQLEAQ
ncbi:hypothetical protein JW935_11530, partial [candidate division KSB1 bacterium]|nr:hypothetical protein [candidate division KSB1 bacterium]